MPGNRVEVIIENFEVEDTGFLEVEMIYLSGKILWYELLEEISGNGHLIYQQARDTGPIQVDISDKRDPPKYKKHNFEVWPNSPPVRVFL